MSQATDLQDTLREVLAEWAPRLGLQDYRIDLAVVPPAAFGDNQTLGDCDAFRMKRRATIRLLEPGHVGVEDDVDDAETTLVHELLHLVLPMVLFDIRPNVGDLRYQLYEQGIDRLARTLVAMSHAQSPPPAPTPPAPLAIEPPWPDHARILRLRLHKLVADWRELANDKTKGMSRRVSAAFEACADSVECVVESED
jgi:hypothetical protein